MSAKGKLFRSSPLCSSEADDITDNENDEEVVAIFQRSQPVGGKRSAHEDEPSQPVGGKRSAHEDEESSFPESAAKPTNVTDWSPEQVKKWIFGLFGDAVAQKFIEEEIDGRALLESKRLEEDSTLEKLGITTIGKKERFKRELGAIRPIVNDNSLPFGRKKSRIDTSSFRNYDRLLTREEREHLSCKDKSIYNTKKKKITKEVEKHWPRSSVLPNYRNKADVLQVNEFVKKLLLEDKSLLFPECGLQREAVLEIVLKKIRELRRQQKDIPLTQEELLSTDSASESSSSSSSSPPSSQLDRVKRYNLYFDEDMTQSTADLIVMIFLEKSSIKDVKMDQLHKLKKSFSLSLLRGKDKPTHVRAIANALSTEGYIKISEEANRASLTRSDIQVVKKVQELDES